MAFETRPEQTHSSEIDRALAYYRDIFEGDAVTEGSVLAMEVGDSGYCAYWAVEVDTAGRYWLGPLFRVDVEPSDSAALIRRDPDGYRVDFLTVIDYGRNRFYDHVIPAGEVDSTELGRFYGLPVAEVIGDAHKLPGFYCDENGQPPSPGKKGEHYMAADTRSLERLRDVNNIYGLMPPERLEP